MKKNALAICARSDPKYGDRYVLRDDLEPEHRSCFQCGADLWVSPTTTAMESDVDLVLTYACNPCGNQSVRQKGASKLAFAPGALPGTTADQRRRRNELEAHGFEEYKP